MITVLEGKHEEEETIDLFITHTNHLLVHKWIENGILHSQFVVDNVRSRVTAMRDRGNYHILFINCKSELVYLRRHYDEQEQQWINQFTIISEEINISQYEMLPETELENQPQLIKSEEKIIALVAASFQKSMHIFYLNEKRKLVHYHESNSNWIKQIEKQDVLWEQIKDNCEPIGDEGWHADAFYNKKLNLIAKKMRNPNSYLINNEILSLDYLSTFLPIKCHHQIISKGAVGGLTMSLINGDKWDNILKQEENIFKASSIARVAFVVKLAKVIKLLQINRFCHGDLHLSNVLITLNHCDRVHPQFDIDVIDFGNGFIFEQGQLVSKGLTGLEIIVPFEVESIKKKNYNPIGINAYQLGRNALQILLLSPHAQTGRLNYFATQELELLRQKKEYPRQLYTFINGLLHQDPYERNVHLMTPLDDFQQKTRQIDLQFHKE